MLDEATSYEVAFAATFVIKSRLQAFTSRDETREKKRWPFRDVSEKERSRRDEKSVWNGAEKDGRPPPDRNKITENSRESWSRTFEKGLEIPLRAIEFVSPTRNLYERMISKD